MRLLALALAVAMVVPGGDGTRNIAAAGGRNGCSPWHGWQTAPRTIRVFRIHHRGSSVPARVDVVPFRLYVERVMASGAWPAHKPMASLRAGAVVIAQRAAYQIAHHDRRFTWRGRCYDIHPGSVRMGLRGTGADAGQYYRSDVRVHSRIKAAVDYALGRWLVRNGRVPKFGWHGEAGRPNGWRLPEDSVTRRAREGWSAERILHVYLAPVVIRVRPS